MGVVCICPSVVPTSRPRHVHVTWERRRDIFLTTSPIFHHNVAHLSYLPSSCPHSHSGETKWTGKIGGATGRESRTEVEVEVEVEAEVEAEAEAGARAGGADAEAGAGVEAGAGKAEEAGAA